MATVEFRYDPKPTAWFTANAAMILKAGEPAYHATTGLFKLGDGVTALSALSFLPSIAEVQTLNNVLALGNTTGAYDIVITDGQKLSSSGTTNTFHLKYNTNDARLFAEGNIHLFSDNASVVIHQSPVLTNETASRLLILNGSKEIITADTATYPSLTELTYVKGVTGAIQTQLNAKQAALSGTGLVYSTAGTISYYTTTGTGTTAVLSTGPTISTSLVLNGYLDLGTTAPSNSNGRAWYTAGNTDGFVFYSNDATNTGYHTQWKNSTVGLGSYLANTGGTPVQFGSTTNHAFGLYVNGGSPKIRIETNGNVSINSSTDPGCAFGVTGTTNLNGATLTGRILDIKQDTATTSIGSLTTDTARTAIYMNQATPSGTNYSLSATSTNTYLNGVSSITFNIGGSQYGRIRNSDWNFNNGVAGGGSAIQYLFTCAANAAQTTTVNVPSFKVVGSTIQWATGTLAAQYFSYFSTNTISFAGASSATLSANLVVDYVLGGTNSTLVTSSAIYVPTLTLTNTTNGYALNLEAPTGASGINAVIKMLDGSATMYIGQAAAGVGAIWLNSAAKTTTNPTIAADSSNTIIRGITSLIQRIGNTTYATLTANNFTLASGTSLTLGNAAVTGLVAGALAALTNATIVITDSTGQAYRVPVII